MTPCSIVFKDFDELADHLAWGLSPIYGIRYDDRDEVYGTCTLVFDIDYMKRDSPIDGEPLIAPADLVFYDARDLLLSCDFRGCYMGKIVIHDIAKQAANDHAKQDCLYTFDLLYPNATMSLTASSVAIYQRDEFRLRSACRRRTYRLTNGI
jgi:hypothetical protein